MGAPFKYLSSWKTEDLFKNFYTQASVNALFLKLDQTSPQTVSNGAPKFSEGIKIKYGKKLILDGS